jgi:hypothetical protein
MMCSVATTNKKVTVMMVKSWRELAFWFGDLSAARKREPSLAVGGCQGIPTFNAYRTDSTLLLTHNPRVQSETTVRLTTY